VYGPPSSTIRCPTTSRAPPKRCRHNEWLSSTTSPAPSASSGKKPRPSSGVAPSARNADGARSAVSTCAGSPLPVSATPNTPRCAPIAENERVRAAHST
jgi:hypothetical protein